MDAARVLQSLLEDPIDTLSDLPTCPSEDQPPGGEPLPPSEPPEPQRSAPKTHHPDQACPAKAVPARPHDSPEALARFASGLDLVEMNARQTRARLRDGVVLLDDLRSLGRLGLLRAARTFDETRGVPFRRWANQCIRYALADGVRLMCHDPRPERAAESEQPPLDVWLDSLAAGEDGDLGPSTAESADARLTTHLVGLATSLAMRTLATGTDACPEALAVRNELGERIRAAVARLPGTERTLVERHYFEDETLDAIATSLGLSKSWASRLHARALERIGRALRRLDMP